MISKKDAYVMQAGLNDFSLFFCHGNILGNHPQPFLPSFHPPSTPFLNIPNHQSLFSLISNSFTRVIATFVYAFLVLCLSLPLD